MKKLSYILLCGLMLILSACEKDTESANFAPVVTTGSASNIYRMGASLSGSITLTETNTAKEYGILFSELESMAEYDEYPVKDGSTSYSVLIQNLEPGTTYYYCAYASSGYSIAKSQIKSFTTTQSNAPVFNEVILQSKDEKSCVVSVELLDEGGSELQISGFVWGEASSGEPTIYSTPVNVGLQGNKMSATIKGMEPNKTYLVRAYAVNAQGVGYSNSLSVTTNTATVPFMGDVLCIDSTEVSVTLKSSVIDAGLGDVTKYGFCYSSESKEPTTAHLVVETVEGDTDEFTALIENLNPETTYYFRAYAENEKGVGYSNVITYTTQQVLIQGSEGDVYVEEAGGLSKFIDDSNKYNITKLKVSGYLNGDDIRLIREMAGRDVNGNETSGRLVDLDISEATIVDGGGAYTIDEGGHSFYTTDNMIGEGMFVATILQTISLPNDITSIGIGAFYKCSSLTSINIPDSVTEIGDNTFGDCSSLNSIVIPDGVTMINDYVFNGCSSLTSISIPNGVTWIGNQVFSSCSSLTSIDIPNSVTWMGEQVFIGCSSLVSIDLPDSITTIGGFMFYGCLSLTSVDIPVGVTTIGLHTFGFCSSMTSIVLPASVTMISNQAFIGCSSLSEVICNATTPPILDYNVFTDIAKPATLYVPTGCTSVYKSSDWANYFSIIKSEGETDSGEGGFDDMPNIEW